METEHIPGGAPENSCARLTKREREVIEMTTLGLTNGEIAPRLNMTTHAVKFHLASIYRKLGVSNRTEAAITYLRATNDATNGG